MLVDVAIPNTRLDFLTYETPEALQRGDLVLVPLRDKLKYGIIVNTDSHREVQHIKKVRELVEQKFIPSTMMKLYQWMSAYYLSALGEVLRHALPSKVLKKFESAGRTVELPVVASFRTPTYLQSNAITRIRSALNARRYKTFLLYGVTGSGKTEVYMRAAEDVVNGGGRVLVLVPEITMTPLIFNRFKERFGSNVVTIHSNLTKKQRREAWYGIKNGAFRIVIGPRSTIFVPIPDLRLIIVDEEHDHSYKEHQQLLKYNARDTAVVRGKLENAVVILGSATPQVESYYNAGMGKYELLVLKERIDARPMPVVEIVDLKKEKRKFVTRALEKRLSEAMLSNEQAIMFLNRRGFAPSLICPDCGFTMRCPYCKLPLVYHRRTGSDGGSILSCHTCDYKTGYVSVCPKCGRATMLYRGAGTQRIEEMVKKLIEEKKLDTQHETETFLLRLDRDVARKRGEAERILELFEQKKARILIGTQLVTKGFDFPSVTFVGIVNADVVLNLPDFRGGERTFQILTQVAGRCGRGERPGTVVIQTFNPEQYAIIFSQLQNFPRFFAQEIRLRRELNFPPFSKLVLLRISGKKEENVASEAQKVHDAVSRIKGVRVYGPNRSFYYRIRQNCRMYVLVKLPLKFPHKRFEFLRHMKLSSVKLEIDVDPVEVF